MRQQPGLFRRIIGFLVPLAMTVGGGIWVMWLYLSDGSFSMGLGALLLTVLGIYWLWLEWIDYINPQPDLEGRRREHGRRAH